jgi:hypothetical protein
MGKMVIEMHPKVQSYEDARRFSVKYGKRVWGVYFRVKIDQEGNLSITIDGIGKIGKGFIRESKLKRDASASGDHQVLETLNFIPTKDEKNALKLEKEFHKYLAKRWCPPAISTDGIKGGKEWFNSWSKNPDEAIKEFIEIGKVLLQDKTIGRINFEFKHDTQESDYNMVVEIVDEFGRVLVHFHTAWGKTTASPKWVVDLCEPGDVALFTTPIVETLSSLVEKINGTPRNPAFEYGKEIEVIETKDITDISETISNIEQYKKEGKIVLICLSVQDLRYDDSEKKEEVREIRKKYKALFDEFNIKLWIRDEFHKEYNGPKTIKVFENIKSEKLIDLTAATHKLLSLYGHEYPNPKMIVKRDLLDALYEKKVKKNPDYKDFPDYLLECGPNYETTLCSNEFRDMFTVEEGQTPRKQFRLDDNLNFVYENEVIEYFKRRYDGQVLVNGMYQNVGDKNPHYLGKEYGATIVVLPEGEENYTATDIQNAAKKVGNTHIKNRLHFTAQDFLNEKKRGFSGNEIQENWLKMAEEQGKDGFNLYVHMQLTTGSDMPPLNSGVINDIIKSPDRFIQTIGRPSRTYPGKDTVKIYLDAPGVVLSTKSMVYQMAKDKAPNDPKKAEELYNCLPITEYMKDGTTRCVTFEEGMKQYNKDMARYIEDNRIPPSFINKFPEVIEIIEGMEYEYRKSDVTPELELTGDIGSKTKKRSNDPAKRTGLVRYQPRVETLSTMLTESGKIDVCEGHDNIQSVFNNPGGMAQQFFGSNNIKMIQAALYNPEFNSAISDWYSRNKEEYKNKSKEDIVKSENIFTNAKFKVKANIVYLPKEFVLNKILDKIVNPNPESILVENALNGMIPILLKERFPDTRIVCVEHFPYYVDHLKSMGFETYTYDTEKNKIDFGSVNNNVFSLLNTGSQIFNYIVMNPPYGPDIKIFNNSFDNLLLPGKGNKIICLQPSTPLINRKPTADLPKTKRIKEIVSEHKTCLELVNGNEIFDAAFFTPLMVNTVEKVKDKKIEVIYSHINPDNKEVKVYDKLDDIFIHGDDRVLGIRDNIFSKMTTSIWDNVSRKGSFDNNYVKINTVCGNPPKSGKLNPDFFCLIYKADEYKKDKLVIPHKSLPLDTGDKNYISVSTREEGNNCFDYLLTKFARFCLSLYKMNSQLSRGELLAVPYMDFTQKWDDEKLFNHFGFTQEEIDFINEYIQDWYEQDTK